MWKPLALELALRGHHIYFVAPKFDSDLARNANVTFDFTGVSMEDYVNSTSIFEGNYMTNVSGLIEGTLRVGFDEWYELETISY